ncbi:MAG: hypothetical protein S0880_15755 [Actinomycetota bacterium]|nr:hypothetical protein [Actinomycetota bacterium]
MRADVQASGRRAAGAATLAAVAILAAACSGGGGDSSATTTSGEPTTTAVAAGDGGDGTTTTTPSGGGTTEPVTMTASSPPGEGTDGGGSIDVSGEGAEAIVLLELDGVGYVADPAAGVIREVAFGAPLDEVVAAVAGISGAPVEEVDQPDCPAGPARLLTFADGLTLVGRDGAFVGWSLGPDADPALAAVGGIGIGSSVEQVRSVLADVVVEETGLGRQLRAEVDDENVEGSLFGLVDGEGDDALLTDLWAGDACAFG